ncbi:FAD:protein FMN transferase [Thiocapsa sp.]|uniref:FAD:protein FMN transferase n=1 Tax=Thiocapsa sp. TaxID=2024551 RepID=UPI003593FAB7
MYLQQIQFSAMGTRCDLQLYTASQRQARQVRDIVIADVSRLEKRYSRYLPGSYLSEINRCAAGGGSISVDEETAGLLNYADTCYRESGGLFDISSGVLRKLWAKDQLKNGLPDAAAIAVLLDRVGWQKLQWTGSQLTFTQAGMELDMGGIVKEYAADRSCNLCRENGIEYGLVNLGGDIAIIGPHADGSPWNIAVRHPSDPSVPLTTLQLSSGALASSGDYERCVMIADKRYGHIINPITGWPTHELVAVSVHADFCLVAGSAATIGMLKEHAGKTWLAELGLSHVWMDVDGDSFVDF